MTVKIRHTRSLSMPDAASLIDQGRKVEMKTAKTLKLGLGLVSLASFAVPTAMGNTPMTRSHSQDPATQKAPATVTINGKVSAVTENSLTVMDDKKAEMTVGIDAKTKITKAGKVVTAADIKPEDAVIVVAAKGEGDALTAVTIKVS